MQDAQRSDEVLFLQPQHFQHPLLLFLHNGGGRDERYTEADLYGILNCGNVIQFHHHPRLHAMFAEDLVEGVPRRYILRTGDEGAPVEVLDGNVPFFPQGMVGRTDHNQPVLGEGDHFDIALGPGIIHNPNAYIAVGYLVVDLPGPVVVQVQVDLGIGFEVSFDIGPQFEHSDAVDGRDADGAGDHVSKRIQPVLHLLVTPDDLPGIAVEDLPAGSEV